VKPAAASSVVAAVAAVAAAAAVVAVATAEVSAQAVPTLVPAAVVAAPMSTESMKVAAFDEVETLATTVAIAHSTDHMIILM
jgi:hypothetical protein